MNNTNKIRPSFVKHSYVNPLNKAFEELKFDKNFVMQMWEDAGKRGEQSTLLSLIKNNKGIPLRNEFYDKGYYNYERMMLDLYRNEADDTEKVDRSWEVFNPQTGNYEMVTQKMTEKEWITKQLNDAYEARRYELVKLQEQRRKDSMGWLAKVGTTAISTLAELTEGFVSGVTGLIDTGIALLYAPIASIATGTSFLDNFSAWYGQGLTSLEKDSFRAALDEYERTSTYMRDIDGNYTTFGKYAAGVTNSIGMMAPSMLMNVVAPGSGQLMFYLNAFGNNVYENETNPLTKNTPGWLKIGNAALSSTAEWLVEWGLGKLLGGTFMNQALGMEGSAIKDLTLKGGLKMMATDALQEGLEEVLQDFSSHLVNVFSDAIIQGNGYGQDGFSFQTLVDAFVMGAMSSIIMSGFSESFYRVSDSIRQSKINRGLEKGIFIENVETGEITTKNGVHVADSKNVIPQYMAKVKDKDFENDLKEKRADLKKLQKSDKPDADAINKLTKEIQQLESSEQRYKTKKKRAFRLSYNNMIRDFNNLMVELNKKGNTISKDADLAKDIYKLLSAQLEFYSGFDIQRIKNVEKLLNRVIESDTAYADYNKAIDDSISYLESEQKKKERAFKELKKSKTLTKEETKELSNKIKESKANIDKVSGKPRLSKETLYNMNKSVYSTQLYRVFTDMVNLKGIKTTESEKKEVKEAIEKKAEELKESKTTQIKKAVHKKEVIDNIVNFKAVEDTIVNVKEANKAFMERVNTPEATIIVSTGADDKLKDIAEGYEWVFTTDGNYAVRFNDILFVPEDWLKNYSKSEIFEFLNEMDLFTAISDAPQFKAFNTSLLDTYKGLTSNPDAKLEEALMNFLFNETFFEYYMLKNNKNKYNAVTFKDNAYKIYKIIEATQRNSKRQLDKNLFAKIESKIKSTQRKPMIRAILNWNLDMYAIGADSVLSEEDKKFVNRWLANKRENANRVKEGKPVVNAYAFDTDFIESLIELPPDMKNIIKRGRAINATEVDRMKAWLIYHTLDADIENKYHYIYNECLPELDKFEHDLNRIKMIESNDEKTRAINRFYGDLIRRAPGVLPKKYSNMLLVKYQNILRTKSEVTVAEIERIYGIYRNYLNDWLSMYNNANLKDTFGLVFSPVQAFPALHKAEDTSLVMSAIDGFKRDYGIDPFNLFRFPQDYNTDKIEIFLDKFYIEGVDKNERIKRFVIKDLERRLGDNFIIVENLFLGNFVVLKKYLGSDILSKDFVNFKFTNNDLLMRGGDYYYDFQSIMLFALTKTETYKKYGLKRASREIYDFVSDPDFIDYTGETFLDRKIKIKLNDILATPIKILDNWTITFDTKHYRRKNFYGATDANNRNIHILLNNREPYDIFHTIIHEINHAIAYSIDLQFGSNVSLVKRDEKYMTWLKNNFTDISKIINMPLEEIGYRLAQNEIFAESYIGNFIPHGTYGGFLKSKSEKEQFMTYSIKHETPISKRPISETINNVFSEMNFNQVQNKRDTYHTKNTRHSSVELNGDILNENIEILTKAFVSIDDIIANPQTYLSKEIKQAIINSGRDINNEGDVYHFLKEYFEDRYGDVSIDRDRYTHRYIYVDDSSFNDLLNNNKIKLEEVVGEHKLSDFYNIDAMNDLNVNPNTVVKVGNNYVNQLVIDKSGYHIELNANTLKSDEDFINKLNHEFRHILQHLHGLEGGFTNDFKVNASFVNDFKKYVPEIFEDGELKEKNKMILTAQLKRLPTKTELETQIAKDAVYALVGGEQNAAGIKSKYLHTKPAFYMEEGGKQYIVMPWYDGKNGKYEIDFIANRYIDDDYSDDEDIGDLGYSDEQYDLEQDITSDKDISKDVSKQIDEDYDEEGNLIKRTKSVKAKSGASQLFDQFLKQGGENKPFVSKPFGSTSFGPQLNPIKSKAPAVKKVSVEEANEAFMKKIKSKAPEDTKVNAEEANKAFMEKIKKSKEFEGLDDDFGDDDDDIKKIEGKKERTQAQKDFIDKQKRKQEHFIKESRKIGYKEEYSKKKYIHREFLGTKEVKDKYGNTKIKNIYKYTYLPKQRTFTDEEAKNTNLKYFVKKDGSRNQIDPNTKQFVIATTGKERFIPMDLWDLIETGKLNKQTFMQWFRDAKSSEINNTLFNMVNDAFFKNKNLKSIKDVDRIATIDAGSYWAVITALLNTEIPAEFFKTKKGIETVVQLVEKIKNKDRNFEFENKINIQRNKYYRIKIDKNKGKTLSDKVPSEKLLKYMRGMIMTFYNGTFDSLMYIARTIRELALHEKEIGTDISLNTSTTGGKSDDSEVEAMQNITYDTNVGQGPFESYEEYLKRIINELVDYNLRIWYKEYKDGKLSYEDLSEMVKNYRKDLENKKEDEVEMTYKNMLSKEVSGIEIEQKPVIFVDALDQDSLDISVKRVRESLQRKIQNRAEFIRDNVTNTEWKNLPDVVKEMFDENHNLKEEVYKVGYHGSTSTINTESIVKTEKRIKDDQKRLQHNLDILSAAEKLIKVKAHKNKVYKRDIDRALKEIAADNRARQVNKNIEGFTAVDIKVPIKSNDTPKVITILSKVPMPKSLEPIYATSYGKFADTKVQFASRDENNTLYQRDSAEFKSRLTHEVSNWDYFYEINAERLLNLTRDEALEIVEFIKSNPHTIDNDNNRLDNIQKTNAFNVFVLGYILANSRRDVWTLSDAEKDNIERAYEMVAGMYGSGLNAVGQMLKVIDPLKTVRQRALEDYGVTPEEFDTIEKSVNELSVAEGKENTREKARKVTKQLKELTQNLAKRNTGKKSVWERVKSIRFLAMLSSPFTWIRNITSNFVVKLLNVASDFAGKIITNKVQYRKDQWNLNGVKISTEVKLFIGDYFMETGVPKSERLFDMLFEKSTKYDDRYGRRSQDNKRNLLVSMIVSAYENKYAAEHRFNKPAMNWISNFVSKMISDKAFIKKVTAKYFGKILTLEMKTDKDIDLSKGLSDKILNLFADSVVMASQEYMHKRSPFTDMLENLKMSDSKGAKAFYEVITLWQPFLNSGWNWFAETLKYTPLGLAKAIYNFCKLEKTITKIDTDRAKGLLTNNPRLAEYLARRDIGKGVIGTIGTILGFLLGAIGIVKIEEEDEKWKMKVGDVTLDISSLFGTSSVLCGISLGKVIAGEIGFEKMLSTMTQSTLNGFVLSDLLAQHAYDKTLYEGVLTETESFLKSWLPQMWQVLIRMTNNKKIKYSSGMAGMWERWLNSFIPAQPFGSRVVNPYTGENTTEYAMPVIGDLFASGFGIGIKAVWKTVDDIELMAREYGVNKSQLQTKITQDGVEYFIKDSYKLNLQYGQLNKKALEQLSTSSTRYKVQAPDGKYSMLTFNQMSDEQKGLIINRIMLQNAEYAKIYQWTKEGHKYYCNNEERLELKKLGITTNIFVGDKGFVK